MDNDLPPSPSPGEEKLLLVTLALNDAFRNGNWAEASQLLDQRTLVVDELLASSDARDPKLLDRCSDVGKQLLSNLHGYRQEIGQELRKLALWKRAHHLYKSAK